MRVGAPLAALVLIAAALVIPPSGEVLAPTASAQTAPRVDVKIKNSAYDPPVITILKGSSVFWTNEDSGPSGLHSVTSDDGVTPAFDKNVFPVEFKGAGVNPQSQSFTALGVVKYHCEYHSSMHGEIRVVAAFTTPFVNVVAKDDGNSFRFDPNSMRINGTQKVNFTNGGSANHNVVFEDASLGKAGELPAGNSAPVTVTFSKDGLFKYRCTYHSTDFSTGMRGDVLVGNTTTSKTPPTVTISSPTSGATVNGKVDVAGQATDGENGVQVSGVQVRIGGNGTWIAATTSGTSWTYSWDTTTRADGAVTVYARALSAEFPDPSPVSVDVTVGNAGARASSGTPTASASPKGDTGIPAPGATVLLALVALAVVVARRRL